MLTQGTHTLRWTYNKDVTVSNGLDAAWIDDIVLPTSLYMTNPEITDFGTLEIMTMIMTGFDIPTTSTR